MRLIFSKTNLKYPFYLFLAIFIAKFGYIIVESFYNYHVLVTTTSADLSKEAIESLNKNGHRISAVGITLLLAPFFYILVKKYSDKIIYSSLAIATIITYSITYNLLNSAVDAIVESNKDKRHDAYYVNIFKYGILNNIFAYDSFIDSEKIAQNKLTVNDRILLTNSFLLLHADQELIDKLKERGKEAVADIYISKYNKEDYEKSFHAFENATQQIQTLWNEFNESRKKLHEELKKYEDEGLIKKAHKDLIASVKESYKNYLKSWENVEKRLEKETSPSNIKEIQRDLRKYFTYQSSTRAQQQYKKKMFESFGYYIEPMRWKDNNGRLTEESIKKLITNEIISQANKKAKGLPKGLNAKEFFNHLDVKVEVAQKLKSNGIQIPVEFNYTYNQFKEYYTVSLTSEHNNATKTFYTKLEQQIGKNDLKLNMDWNDFINSEYIKNQIKSQLNIADEKEIQNILRVIQSKDLGNFKRLIYLPKIVKEVEAMMYKPEDFKDGGIAWQEGDEAIKLLYIPPFALLVSLLALLLNIVTVFGMSLEYTKIFSTLQINIAKGILIIVFISLPFVSSYNALDNKLLNNANLTQLKSYMSVLKWFSYYEQINANIH